MKAREFWIEQGKQPTILTDKTNWQMHCYFEPIHVREVLPNTVTISKVSLQEFVDWFHAHDGAPLPEWVWAKVNEFEEALASTDTTAGQDG